MPRFPDRLRLKRRSALLAPATEAADLADAGVVTPLATLLAGNVIPQGELVHLLIKPSRWFILLNSALFSAVTVVAIGASHLLGVKFLLSTSLCVQSAVFLVAGRVMWSVVQWMGRYYILTDYRVVRVSGIFDVDIQSCRLRKVDQVNLYTTIGERVLGKGCVELLNEDPKKMTWQTISRPARIHRAVAAAVARSKSNGHGGL